MFWGMAKKSNRFDYEKAGFHLTVGMALVSLGVFLFNWGKDEGIQEQRLTQLEQRVELVSPNPLAIPAN